MSYLPPFVSEWPDVHLVADCVPASGLMLANKVTLGKYPASVAEREALQDRMGTQDNGADAAQLAAGMNLRYHLGLVPGVGWEYIASRLADPGRGVAIFGTYQSLPGAIRDHGNQATYQGGHAMYAQGDGAGTVTLGDPLASSYLPRVPLTALQAFCNGLGQQFLGGSQSVQQVGLRAVVGPGAVTFYRVLRFTHALYAPLHTSWAAGSPAPVALGSTGFYAVTDGAYRGRYLVAGRSGPFAVYAVYSDGTRRLVGRYA